jgi:hypothetical protein
MELTALELEKNGNKDSAARFRSQSETSILTVLAIVFFLLGVAQSSVRMRLFFAGLAVVIMVLAAVWTGYIIIA